MSATVIAILIIVAVMGILTLSAILHAGTREFESVGQKAIWVLVAAIPFIGFVFYFLIGARQARKDGTPPSDTDAV